MPIVQATKAALLKSVKALPTLWSSSELSSEVTEGFIRSLPEDQRARHYHNLFC